MRFRISSRIAWLAILVASQALAQTDHVIAVHRASPAAPPTLPLLPQSASAHPGNVSLGYDDSGLWVRVDVQTGDGGPQWPKEKSETLASDHVEIWLAASTDVEMPPVAWGNQFGLKTLNSPQDCSKLNDGPGAPQSGAENCVRWYNLQLAYRKQFKRLFARQWLVAGTGLGEDCHVFEDFASTAYANLAADFYENELPSSLKPADNSGIQSHCRAVNGEQAVKQNAGGQSYTQNIPAGYSISFFIPYRAFPPAQQFDLHDLWIMVDVFGAAPEGKKMGALSTTSAKRVWGAPSSFNHVSLDQPRIHTLGPCNASPVTKNLEEESTRAWYFPQGGKGPLKLDTAYHLESPAEGYMYDPAGVSPTVATKSYFWKQLSNGATICGPQLAYRKGEQIKTSEFFLDKKYFATLTLLDGWTLVRTGPDMGTLSPFGSGACGSCPVMSFAILAISPTGEITTALTLDESYGGFNDGPAAGDMAIAPDWSRISLYSDQESFIDNGKGGKVDTWTETNYCLAGHEYKECGKQTGVQPPKPPNFREMSEDD